MRAESLRASTAFEARERSAPLPDACQSVASGDEGPWPTPASVRMLPVVYGSEDVVEFIETDLQGAYVVRPEPVSDTRGSFQRIWCDREFADAGIEMRPRQANLATTHAAGTLRGLHYQLPPESEAKLVRCTRGAIWDVIVDLRPDSSTYLQHAAVTLTAENRHALYVPDLFAHAYLTLEDNSDVLYQVSRPYAPGLERGIRWNDPALDLVPPIGVRVVSEKDRGWPDLEPAALADTIRTALRSSRT